jgi:hypothetical protein
MTPFETPIAFFVFNRPEITARSFERIRALRPRRLLICADGPRAHRPEERGKTEAVRAIVSRIDWECDSRTRLLEENLGCKKAVSSGISWVFEQVDRAIILEDDCLPDASFFLFCAELLERYQNDPRVFMISGNHLRRLPEDYAHSYYFSCIPHIWGWATWRRAWQHYRVDMDGWSAWKNAGEMRKRFHGSGLAHRIALWRLTGMLDKTARGEIDTWDHQWHYTLLRNRGLSILPAVPLVENVGFGQDATHTLDARDQPTERAQPMRFPLSHPEGPSPELSQERAHDAAWLRETFGNARAMGRAVARKIGKLLHV